MTRRLAIIALLLAACSSAPSSTSTPGEVAQAKAPDAAPPPADAAPPPPPHLLTPASPMAPMAPGSRVAARVFAFADTQLHYMFGKRTFAQSPFADRMAFEVAVRPAALDDGSDLLLESFAKDYANHYRDHSLVFLGDAADLSCEQELIEFQRILTNAGAVGLHAVTSNHDGYFVGNFTSKDDLDGKLALTDMPHDWTRACSYPGSFRDQRLTKGRAVARLAEELPEAPLWASSIAHLGAHGPGDYEASWMYYVRKLGGGDASAPPVWGIFLDTVDYRDFDLKSGEGAGTNGSVSRLQMRFLDRAMFEVGGLTPGVEPVFVAFGHHPISTLEPKARKRVKAFFTRHPRIVGYISAHEHSPGRRKIQLGKRRKIPELVIGSTTDAPHSATRIEVRYGSHGPYLDSEDLVFDQAQCDQVKPMPPTSVGYTGYRINRDDTPDVDIGITDKLAFAVGLSELEEERAKQAIGALLVENELVRSLADLYLRSPLQLNPAEHAQLTAIMSKRYAAGNKRARLELYLRGKAVNPARLTKYDRWDDPVVAKVVSVAAQGVHRFGPHHTLFKALRARRRKTPAAHRYFMCHAAYAADAESKRAKKRAGVLYIR